MTTIKPMPGWMKMILGHYAWMTFTPVIYFGDTPDGEYNASLAHEQTHIRQQEAMGQWKWLWRYFTNATFRLDQEAEGYAAEIIWYLDNTPALAIGARMNAISELSTGYHLNITPKQAEAALSVTLKGR